MRRWLWVLFPLIAIHPAYGETLADNPDTPPRATAPSRWVLSAGLSFPSNLFSLTGPAFDTPTGPKNWRASFVPVFAPVLRLGTAYDGIQVGLSHKLNSEARYNSVRLELPLGAWALRFSWQDFRGMRQQLALTDANPDTASVGFDSRLPHQAREDVGFFSASLGVVARPAVLAPEESTLIPFLGANLLLQSFVSDSGIIAVEQRSLLGEGADLRELKQGGLALDAGLDWRLRLTPQSELLVGGSGILRLLAGRATFAASSVSGVELSPGGNGRLAWIHRSGPSTYELDFLMEGFSSRVGGLKLAPLHLAFGASYSFAW